MDWITPNLGVCEFWREGRKISDRNLRANAMISYRQMMEERTRWFLAQLYANPKEHHHHIELSLCRLPYIIWLLTTGQPSRETYHVSRIWLRLEGW